MKRVFRLMSLCVAVAAILLLSSVLCLRWVNPPFTSFTLQQDWSELDRERYNLRAHWVHQEEIPENLIHAVVASEDQRFFQHNGFDWDSIREAYNDRISGVRERGASTLSQQVAKNLFLWPDPSIIRKGGEVGITFLIELFWSKERILNVYLNIAEFGPGLFGVGLASQEYFNHPASELTPLESSRLVAVLPSPLRIRVNPPSQYTIDRSQWILRQMTMMTGIRYLPETTLSPDSTNVTNEIPDYYQIEPFPETVDSAGREEYRMGGGELDSVSSDRNSEAVIDSLERFIIP